MGSSSSASPSEAGRGPAPVLYLITDRHATAGRPLPVVLARALEGAGSGGGGDRRLPIAVQLREKDLYGAALLALARDLRALTRAAGVDLFVNDRVDVAAAVGAEGVHLSGTSLSPTDVRTVTPDLAVAVSTHSVDDVRRAALETNVRFAVLGPVFDTPSKRKFGRPLGQDVLSAASSQPLPIVALGGITPANAALCLKQGAVGLACIRAVLQAPDPAVAVRDFLNAIDSYRRKQ